MNSTTKAKGTFETPTDFNAVVEDLAALRRDFAAMMNQLKVDAIDGVNDTAETTIGKFSDRANAIYENVKAQGERSTRTLSHQVEEHPVTSLLIAFGAGFIASKMLMR